MEGRGRGRETQAQRGRESESANNVEKAMCKYHPCPCLSTARDTEMNPYTVAFTWDTFPPYQDTWYKDCRVLTWCHLQTGVSRSNPEVMNKKKKAAQISSNMNHDQVSKCQQRRKMTQAVKSKPGPILLSQDVQATCWDVQDWCFFFCVSCGYILQETTTIDPIIYNHFIYF